MKILMIEDSEGKRDSILRSISSIVKPEEVEVCTNANDGLYALYKNKGSYDFLILDMQFPVSRGSRDIDRECGLHVLQELKRTKNMVPVIICSSSVVDYSEYDRGNVKGYIVYDSSVDMSGQFKSFML